MDTRFHSICQRGALLALAASLAACASTTPHLDTGFGTSVRSTFAAQVIDPAAVRNPDPVTGLDGRTARAAQEQYERSNAAPQSAPAPLLNSGSVR
jgi:type IV pilus biogenesis protein CpaD/CtpE